MRATIPQLLPVMSDSQLSCIIVIIIVIIAINKTTNKIRTTLHQTVNESETANQKHC